MRSIGIVLAGVINLAGLAQGGPAESSQPQPELTPSQGLALIGLVRQTMADYLLTRNDANRAKTPADLAELNYPAAVTLRSNGEIVAQIIKADDNSLTANVASAALKAMRSEKLPNRVNQAVLDSLTVEVEVIGREVPAVQGDLEDLIEPGLTGLALSRGQKKAFALPSTAYELGIGADQMQMLCLSQIPLNPTILNDQPQWSLFATRHFVGLGDELVVELFRGKRLSEFNSLDEQTLTEAARAIGRHLQRKQDFSGQYHTESGKPSLRDHFYAAYSMSKLATATGNKKFADSATDALLGASRSINKGPVGSYVLTPNPNNQLASTAYLAMALFLMPEIEDAESVMGELVAAMKADFLANGRFTGRLDGHGVSVASPEDQATAAMAIKQIAPQPQLLENISKAINLAKTPEAMLWASRAGLSPFPAEGIEGFSQSRENRPVDERGGYFIDNETPTVNFTAVLALCETAPAEARLAARRFCYKMVFRPGEAYFAPNPDQWVGTVRSAPTSPEVSLAGCARAIEALLGR